MHLVFYVLRIYAILVLYFSLFHIPCTAISSYLHLAGFVRFCCTKAKFRDCALRGLILHKSQGLYMCVGSGLTLAPETGSGTTLALHLAGFVRFCCTKAKFRDCALRGLILHKSQGLYMCVGSGLTLAPETGSGTTLASALAFLAHHLGLWNGV